MGPFRRLLTLMFVLTALINTSLAQSSAAANDDDATAAAGRSTRDRGVSLPRTVRFSGVVRGADDAARSGVVTLTFTLYSEPQGGSPVWVETQNVTLDENGRYTALLGTTSDRGLPVALFAHGEARWLGVRVAEEGAGEQSRVQLVSVPYALAAADAQSLGGRPVSDFQLTRTAAATSSDGSAAPGVEPSGTVTSTTNTINRVAKFTALDTLGDSSIFDNGTNVGIGTTTPSFPLHILANSTSAALAVAQNNANGFGLLVRSGNDLTPAFLMNNAANSANKHIFYGNGDAALGLGGGRIGIGTSGPAYPLHIEANNTSAAMTLVQNNVNGFAMLVRSGNDNTPAFLMNNAANSANRHIFYGSGDAYFALGGGNVGIGTSGPSQKLQVAGTIYSSTGGFRFPDNTVQTTAATGGGGGGDITGVTAGNGLAGGATSGDATLSIKTCTEGQILKYFGTTWTCFSDSGGGTPSTQTFTIPGPAFNNLGAKVVAVRMTLDNNASTTNRGWFILPFDGGTITALRVCGRDNDAQGQIIARLYRRSKILSVFTDAELMASIGSGAAFGSDTTQCFSTTTITNGAIDSVNYAYTIELEMSAFVQVNAVQVDNLDN